MNHLPKVINQKFSFLEEYIVEYSKNHLVFYIPSSVDVNFNFKLMKENFEEVTIKSDLHQMPRLKPFDPPKHFLAGRWITCKLRATPSTNSTQGHNTKK